MASGVQPPENLSKRISIEARLVIAAYAPLLAALFCAAAIVYVGIKGDQVQVYRTGSLKASVAATIICFINEKALSKQSMTYDEFDSLLKANSVKLNIPLANFCFNMIRDGNLQKKAYEDGRRIVLTPAGEKRAATALRALATSKAGKPE